MKKVIFLTISLLLIPFLSSAQTIKDVDYISPFIEGVSAIKKDNQWAFINTEGTIVIDYRDDLVVTKSKTGNYPVFSNGRCLITQKKDGISYYGYIDASGKTVISPQFLNAINFKNNNAIVLVLEKKDMGKNVAVGKTMYVYEYFEALISTSGNIENSLTEPKTIGLTAKNLVKPPVITSKIINELSNLIAIKGKDKKYSIKKIKTKN